MFRNFQFNISTILVATSLVSLILVRNSFWATVAASELLIVCLGADSLVKYFPTAIRRVMYANGFRLDGTRSDRRESIEVKSFGKFKRNVIFVFLLILLPTNIILFLVRVGIVRWISDLNYPDSPISDRGVFQINAIVMIVWFFLAFLITKFGYLILLKRLARSVSSRAERYRLCDWEASQQRD